MDNRRNIKENIKSVILVVLFLLTILLLYFFWKDISFSDVTLDDFKISLRDEIEETLPPEKVIIPSHIDICLDNETYTRIDSRAAQYWIGKEGNGMIDAFKKAISSGDEFTEEITAEQYDTVMSLLSAKAVFEYYLPFKEFCNFLGISNPAGEEMIENISEIGFSTGSSESIFIRDMEKNKYYRIVSDLSTDELLADIEEDMVSGNTTYYPLESYVGVDIAKDVLVPSFLESDLRKIPGRPDFGSKDKEVANRIAQNFFSGSFDFVRKIEEESGKTTFVYGNADKVLTIDRNGRAEYHAYVEGGPSVGYFNSLIIALATISEQGGFRTAGGDKFIPYISRVDKYALPDEIYRFEFGMMLNGEKVYYKEGNAVIVEVKNGEVIYFAREYKQPETGFEKKNVQTEQILQEAHSPVNVLAQNYEYIYTKMKEQADAYSEIIKMSDDDRKLPPEKRFEYVTSKINDMGTGYYYSENAGGFIPCHVISLFDDGLRVYFDLYTAEPLL